MADPLRKPPADEEPDPFRYGSRRKRVRLPSGEVVEQEVPLTAEDLLDPQPGDEVTQSDPHAQIVTTLHELLRRHYEAVQDVVVLFDMKIEWGIPGLPNPSPDLAVIHGAPKRGGRSIYRVAEEGELPSLILEVVSYSDTAMYRNDHKLKVELYQRVGIPEYLIVDPPFPGKDSLTLTGYRLGPDRRYRRIEPDSQGRLHSETTQLFFAPSEDRLAVRVGDAVTGEWLLTGSEEQAARRAAEERAVREAEARRVAEERARQAEAENARLHAELERFKKAGN
jgi:Uma2 family endonuclease